MFPLTITLYFILLLERFTVAFIIYGKDDILYYEEGSSATKSYNESQINCQLLGGRLPNSMEELKKFDLHSNSYQTTDFWLGPRKMLHENHFTWPNGNLYKGIWSDWRKSRSCRLNCCALTAITVLDETVRVNTKEAAQCDSLRRQLCIITNAPGKLNEKLNRIQFHTEKMNESVEKVKSQLNELKSVKSNLTSAVTDLTEEMKRNNLQFMNLTFNPVNGNSSNTSSYYQLNLNDPYLVQREDGSFYYFNRSLGSFEESQIFCENLHGTIPTINNEDDVRFFSTLIGYSANLWLGAGQDDEKNYYWLDNSIFSNAFWAPSYPSCSNECCGIQFSTNRLTFGHMVDANCSTLAFQVCKVFLPDGKSIPLEEKTKRLNVIERQVKTLKHSLSLQNSYLVNMTDSLHLLFKRVENILKKVEG